LSNDVRELERTRENAFCCGAGGAQFWKEEEAGSERISDNRYREAEQTLAAGSENKVLAVGCPFCKSMLQSTPGKDSGMAITVKDVAEMLWERIVGNRQEVMPAYIADVSAAPSAAAVLGDELSADIAQETPRQQALEVFSGAPEIEQVHTGKSPGSTRAKWAPARAKSVLAGETIPEAPQPALHSNSPGVAPVPPNADDAAAATPVQDSVPTGLQGANRKKWAPKTTDKPMSGDLAVASPKPDEAQLSALDSRSHEASIGPAEDGKTATVARKKWTPRNPGA